jgi:hypothetical protein
MPCRNYNGFIVCEPDGPYKYCGIYWEYHPFFGPHPIYAKNGQPWKRVPNYVWKIADNFVKELDRSQFLVCKD